MPTPAGRTTLGFVAPGVQRETVTMLSHCRVVLVRPTTASNIGAVARAMRNLGFRDLVLVAPEADPADRRADLLATRHGRPVLDACRTVPDLDTALADCLFVAATSAVVGGPLRRQSAGPPEDFLPRLLSVLPAGPAALVFGPEPTGLTSAEAARAHALVHLPTSPEAPALNLAQAAGILLYLVRAAWLRQEQPPAPPESPAPFAAQERVYAHLEEALRRVHFLYGPKAEPLMHAVRHLIGRAGPTDMEVKLLHGLARQLLWFADRGPGPREQLNDPPG